MFNKLEKKLIFTLAFVQFNHIVDFMIIMPLGPQLMRLFSISTAQFSLLVSSYTFMAGISGFLASFYTDRFDRKKSLLFLFTGFTLATAFCGFSKNYESLLIARALTGFFGGVMNSMVLSIVSDVIDFKRRGTAMGYLSTAFSVASILGVPLSLQLAHLFGWTAPFIFLSLICLFILVGVYLFVPKIDQHLSEKSDEKFWIPVVNILKNKQQLQALLFMFFVMFSHFCIIPFISPTLVANAGLSEKNLTLIYLIGGVCSILTAPFVGRLADRLGKAKVFKYSIIFSILPILLLTHLNHTHLILILTVSGLFFISAGSRMIPAQALISGVASQKQRGSFMSLLSCIQSLSMAFGAYVAGQIVVSDPQTGQILNYAYVGYLSIIVSLFTLFLLKKLSLIELKPDLDTQDSQLQKT